MDAGLPSITMTTGQNKNSLFQELSRRNVFRVAIAYAGLFWLILQIADVLFPALSLPEWTVRFVAALLILGFPLAIFFAWAYELTPDGLRRERGAEKPGSPAPHDSRKLDFVIIVILAGAVGWFALDKFYWQERVSEQATHAAASSQPDDARGPSEGADAAGENPTIAILPFVNMSADEDQEYFADGLTEELLSVLGRFRSLRVIGRTSSFQFKGRNEDLRTIGEQLGAGYILEGSVRKSGNTVRITAQLVAAEDGVNLWSDSFTRELDNIFEVQDSIAGAVADALQVQILGEVKPAESGTVNAAAYDLYLKGLRFTRPPNEENARLVLKFAREAIAEDPDLSPAWVLLANAYRSLVVYGAIAPQDGIASAREAAAKAAALDPGSADAYRTLGTLRMQFDWDWSGAAEAYARALELDPNNAAALSGAGLLAAARGDTDESIRLLQKSLRLDPLNLGSMHNLAFGYYLAHDFERAEQAFREALAFAGGSYSIGHVNLGLTLVEQGRFESALEESNKIDVEPMRLALHATIYLGLEERAFADEALTTLINKYGDRFAVPIGGNYAKRGELDKAMEWKERAFEQRDAQLTWSMVHPMNANLQGYPRFEALLRKLDLK